MRFFRSIQSGYLTLFDIANSKVAQTFGPGYTGQLSADSTDLYAVQNDGLIAINTVTGKVDWKWFKESEQAIGQIIVTSNLIFVSTNVSTYAISKKDHKAMDERTVFRVTGDKLDALFGA